MKNINVPTAEELEEMLSYGIAITDCPEGCEVEIDGECPHGYQSVFITMGLV